MRPPQTSRADWQLFGKQSKRSRKMKYNRLDLGQIEAIVNKLGGMDGVAKFLAGELIVASPVTSSELVSTSTFIYDKTKDGWKLVENVTEAMDFKIKDLQLVSFLKSGESYVNGEVMRQRAIEMKCNFGQQHAEYLISNQNEISKEFRKYTLVFSGTVWQCPYGCRYVPFLRWNGGQWILNFSWLGDYWNDDNRLLQARK